MFFAPDVDEDGDGGAREDEEDDHHGDDNIKLSVG
jgi:hypothetical protein